MEQLTKFVKSITNMDEFDITEGCSGRYIIKGKTPIKHRTYDFDVRRIVLENYKTYYRYYILETISGFERMTTGNISIENTHKLIKMISEEIKKYE